MNAAQPVGVLLAGGSGQRLNPVTLGVNKHLLPVYNKPMIYYSLSTLLLAGVRDVCVVIDSQYREGFERLLGDGSQLGISLKYKIQKEPRGIAHGLLLCSDELEGRSVAVVLGDNLIHGQGFGRNLQSLLPLEGARIFTSPVAEASEYGVLRVSQDGIPVEVIEKPLSAGPGLAVIGLYFFGPDVVHIAQGLRPSRRGEMEITDLNNAYLEYQRLAVSPLPRGTFWQDLGSPESLFAGSEYVRLTENRSGLRVGCLEEVAWRNGWITDDELAALAVRLPRGPYSQYLLFLLEETSSSSGPRA